MTIANPTQWDIARAAKTMAVRTSVTLDPTLITPRIKNKLIKWLESGYLDGGYRSEARKIGDMLVDKFDLPMSHSSWRGLSLSNPSKELADEVVEVLTADWTAFILENPQYMRAERNWYKDQYNHAMNWLQNDRSGKRFLNTHDNNFRKQVLELVCKHQGEDDKRRVQVAIDAIKSGEPIHLYNYG